MTDPEIHEWLELLSPSSILQLKIVDDLLNHANEDGMSQEDREACLRAKELLT